MTDDEKVKSGYAAALQMITYEGQIIWRSFNSLVAANALLIALGGLGIKEYHSKTVLWLIPALGWVLCICWFVVLQRQMGYYSYWFAWARFFEKRYLSPIVRVTLEGHERFSKGDQAVIDPADASPAMRPKLWGPARLFRIHWFMDVGISIFAI